MESPDAEARIELDGPFDVRRSVPSAGTAADPTHRARTGVVVLGGRTPDGPVGARFTTPGEPPTHLLVEAWGPGAEWLCARGDHLVGRHDDPRPLRFDHPVLDEVNRRNPGVRHTATGLVVDGLLGRVLGQRVLSREAGRSWSELCRDLGGPAPGPLEVLLPPDPARLAGQPTWWFHERGVERSRARTLVAVARHARRLAEVVDLPLPEAYGRMRAVPGLGPWTVNGVARTALGDPDAIIVGDYWMSHSTCSFFTGRPRGSDEEMLDLVERWTGQRGRVQRLIGMSGHDVERFGPGIRTPAIRRM